MSRKPEITSKIMSAIKSKNTKPELILRHALWSKGFRYRINVKSLPGKPDIVFSKVKLIIFCDGDFWHGHNWVLRGIPSFDEELKSYSPFWRDKIHKNVQRDLEITKLLKKNHWSVIRIWESDIKNNLNKCINKIEKKYYFALNRISQ